jgi:hypothetical protein
MAHCAGLDCSDQLASGAADKSDNDFDKESKTTGWWGCTWPQPYNIDQVVYTTGDMSLTAGGMRGAFACR